MKTTSLLILALTFGLPCMADDTTPDAPATERPAPPRVLKRFDKDGDGKLGAEERTALEAARKSIVKHSRGGLAKKSLNHPGPRVLARFDADNDGKLSGEEKNAALEKIKARKGTRGGAHAGNEKGGHGKPGPRILARFDADKDGRLSGEEKTKALEQFTARQSLRLQKLKEKLGTNGDRKVDTTKRGKARDFTRGEAGKPLRQRLMNRFDEDQDGKLNESERTRAREAWQKFRNGSGIKPRAK